MMGAKKINPARRPATQADVEKAHKEGVTAGTNFGLVIFLTAMRDKEGCGPARLMRLWHEIEELCDSVAKGYVKIDDMSAALLEEAGIQII